MTLALTFIALTLATLGLLLFPLLRHATRGRAILSLVIFFAVLAGSFTVYGYLGSPEIPALPYADRKNDPDFLQAAAATRLADQLETKPDAAGYKQLADIYIMLRSYDQAAAIYKKILALNGNDADVWSGLGEATSMANGKTVTPEARAAFAEALRRNPRDARARFYLGLAAAQAGDPRRAVAIWRDLEKSAGPDAVWLNMVRAYIGVFAQQGKFDPASVTPSPPTPQEATAIMAMNPTAQQAVIHKMVDRLAAKMKENPNDRDGWLRLAKAYRVLGENEKAAEAEKKAASLR